MRAAMRRVQDARASGGMLRSSGCDATAAAAWLMGTCRAEATARHRDWVSWTSRHAGLAAAMSIARAGSRDRAEASAWMRELRSSSEKVTNRSGFRDPSASRRRSGVMTSELVEVDEGDGRVREGSGAPGGVQAPMTGRCGPRWRVGSDPTGSREDGLPCKLLLGLASSVKAAARADSEPEREAPVRLSRARRQFPGRVYWSPSVSAVRKAPGLWVLRRGEAGAAGTMGIERAVFLDECSPGSQRQQESFIEDIAFYVSFICRLTPNRYTPPS